MRWFGFVHLKNSSSADKHLILSISLINGLRYGRNKYFEPSTKARHNRGQFPRRLNHLALDEISGGNHLAVGSIDCVTYQFYFIARIDSRVTYQFFKLGNLALND